MQLERHTMTTHTFYIVDVFAESKYAGNQLAVVRDAERVGNVLRVPRAARGTRLGR